MPKVMKPYYSRDRRKALRTAIKDNTVFAHSGDEHDELLTYIEDLAIHLSEQRPSNQAEALAYIIRTMGELVQEHAEDIYAPYGYADPFAPVAAAPAASPALPVWKFPVVNKPPTSGPGVFTGKFRDYSALKMFGYTVGKTAGWPRADRQAFLTQFMECALPPIVAATFGDEYGAPMSTERLRKTANVVASNASNRFRANPLLFALAIADWEDDLQFLKMKYYDGAGLKFQPWPTTRPS
jgi:hypothetical protein